MADDLTRRTFLKRAGGSVAAWGATTNAGGRRAGGESGPTARLHRVVEMEWRSTGRYSDG